MTKGNEYYSPHERRSIPSFRMECKEYKSIMRKAFRFNPSSDLDRT